MLLYYHMDSQFELLCSAVRSSDQPKGEQSCIDIEKLQNEFVFTTAEYLLSLKNFGWTYSGNLSPISSMVCLEFAV